MEDSVTRKTVDQAAELLGFSRRRINNICRTHRLGVWGGENGAIVLLSPEEIEQVQARLAPTLRLQGD